MDINKLKGVIPDNVLAQIPSVMEKFQINTPLRLAHFLAQCATESGTFKVTVENLNYSAERLRVVFPRYFKDDTIAKAYERNPQKIASRVYASRMGNGNEATGDGYKYCGRGYIQLTGKDNYSAFDALVPEAIIDTPGLVATQYPLLSAAWFFTKTGLNAVADTGSTDDVVTKVSKRVNGGTNGLSERIANFHKFYPLLS